MTLQGLDTTSCSAIRITFMALLVAQMNVPLWPTYWEYFYPLDYLTNLGPCSSRIFGICIAWVPSACTGGPAGTLPKYDFVVVGAGPAGSAIAYRLAMQYTSKYILLIEAGGAPPVDVITPTWYPFLQKISSSYSYTAESKILSIVDGTGNTCSRIEGTNSVYGLGYTNGLPCDAGRALGGGTAMNAMLWVCGTSQDYEGWKNSTGDASWGWGTGANNDGMLAYYKKAMKMNDPNIPSTCANFYGTSGPLTVSDSKSTNPTNTLLKDAASQAGYPILADINCGKWIGMANVHVTIKDGERNHAARAYLSPLRTRANVMILRNVIVDKVLLSGTLGGTVTATGVRVVTNNVNCSSFNILAKNEIILTAGALNTPLILQRSGVGRKCDLTGSNNGVNFTIPQLVDSPVGANYHPNDVLFLTTDPTQAEIIASNNQVLDLAAQVETYYFYRNDSLSYIGSLTWDMFLNTNDNPINPNSMPDIQYICYQFDLKQVEFSTILTDKFGIKSEYAQQLLTINQSKKILMCYNILLNPKSRGLVRVRSTDPRDPPRIYTNYVSDPQDIATANAGINKLSNLLTTTAMTNVNATIFKFAITECDSLTYPSDAYWNCYRKYFGQNLWHPAGTCKMGKITDPSAVVDPKLLVKGISGTVKVRVGDASIMPQVTSGNTQCPVYAIGEKAADIIRALYP